MRTLLLALVVASSAFAQGNTGQSTTGISRGNGLRVPQYKTTATQGWFIATTGSDANDCRSVSTPCLTIIGLQAKMPKVIRNPVTVTFATGSYTGGWFSDFSFDPADAATGAYIVLQGTFSNFAPATGTATGTSSGAGTACVLSTTDAALTDSTQTWTVNDLRGQFIETTGGTGSGQFLPIASNTATVVTIAGCWGVTPNATTTYAIRTWDAVITTATNLPPTFISAAGNAIGLGVFNMQDNLRNNNTAFFFIDTLRVNVSSTTAALLVSNTSVYARRSRFDSSGAGPGINLQGNSRLNFQADVATSATGPALTQSTFEGTQSLRGINALFLSGSTTGAGLNLSGQSTAIQNSFVTMTSSSAAFGVFFNEWSAGNNFQGVRITCTAGGTTIGFSANVGTNSSPAVPSGPLGVMFDGSATRECTTGILIAGPSATLTLDDSTFQATAGTTAISINNGSNVLLDSNSVIAGSFTTQIALDGTTALNFADVTPVGVRNTGTNSGVIQIP